MCSATREPEHVAFILHPVLNSLLNGQALIRRYKGEDSHDSWAKERDLYILWGLE